MKSHVLSLALLVAASLSISAQTFVIDWVKPNPIRGTPTGGIVKREGTIRNLNDSAKELYFSYNLSGLSLDHTAQLCIDLCWALYPGPDDPFIREGQILKPNGTLPLYVDCTPNGSEGTSTVAVSLFDGANMSDKVDFEVMFEIATSTSVIDAKEAGIVVGPLPATDNLFVQGSAFAAMRSVALYNAQGSIVRSFGTGSSTLTLAGISTGTYRLIMTNAQGAMFAAPVVVTR